MDGFVTELLGEHIPEDEAKVLNNGRITCLICMHRPVFDTVNVLVLHRKGKKHKSELDKYLNRKEELEFIYSKKKQRLSVQNDLKRKSVLDCRGGSSKLTKFCRKPILELPSNHTEKVVAPDSTSQLEKYLNKLKKKPSFKESLSKVKEGYNPSFNNTSVKEKCNSNLQSSSDKKSHLNSSSSSVEYETKLIMSGWIKDSCGKWVKDPNAEFDSDEEDRPALPTPLPL